MIEELFEAVFSLGSVQRELKPRCDWRVLSQKRVVAIGGQTQLIVSGQEEP
jgi:hypothetical protein